MANTGKPNIASAVRALIEDSIVKSGFILWDVLFYKEGGEHILEIVIDREGDVTIEDCVAANSIAEPIIDRADPIDIPYSLMVTSAGLLRIYSSDEHLSYALTNNIVLEIKLFTAHEGAKSYTGTLRAYNKESIFIDDTEIPRKLISRINTSYEPDTNPSLKTR